MFPCTSVSNIKDGQTTIVWFSLKLTSEPLSLPPPPPTLSPPITHSTNGGSAGNDLSSLIGDKVFSATVATACKSNFSGFHNRRKKASMAPRHAVRMMERWAHTMHPRQPTTLPTESVIGGLIIACRGWLPDRKFQHQQEEKGKGAGPTWQNILTINEGNEGGYPRVTCFGN